MLDTAQPVAPIFLYSMWAAATVGLSCLLSPTLGFTPILGRAGTTASFGGSVLRASSLGDDVEISRADMLKNAGAAATAAVAGD